MSASNTACMVGEFSPRLDGLSEHLIASFWQTKHNGERVNDAQGNPETVFAPLTESSFDVALGWQSPFEGSGTDKATPALSAMLQSGALQPFLGEGKIKNFVSQFEGRTGVTKLNSTQVFSGMAPVKIQVTALFRAWSDPVSEVEEPFDKLMSWALPVELANDGILLSRAIGAIKDGDWNTARMYMPSLAPYLVCMQYKRRLYKNLVIENIQFPMGSPVDRNGRYVELLVPMTLCTLTALDRNDWSNVWRGL